MLFYLSYLRKNNLSCYKKNYLSINMIILALKFLLKFTHLYFLVNQNMSIAILPTAPSRV